jgi:hypothetical protein
VGDYYSPVLRASSSLEVQWSRFATKFNCSVVGFWGKADDVVALLRFDRWVTYTFVLLRLGFVFLFLFVCSGP